MATIYLNDEKMTITPSTDSEGRIKASDVRGTAAGREHAVIAAAATEVTVGATVELLSFAGNVGDFVFSFIPGIDGGLAVWRAGGTGDSPVAVIQGVGGGCELRFFDGGLGVDQNPATGSYLLGGPDGQEIASGEEPVKYDGSGEGLDPARGSRDDYKDSPLPDEGKTYWLPDDLGEANLIASGTGGDTYETTETDGLQKGAQILDASMTDWDVLTMAAKAPNENGKIINVEEIRVNWEGYSAAVINAANISHPSGSRITVNSARTFVKDATVSDVQNHVAEAGTNITGTLTISGARNGAAAILGQARALAVSGSGSSGTLEVRASKDFELAIASGSYAGANDAIVIRTDEDILVTAKDDDTWRGKAFERAGSGSVSLGVGTVSGSDLDVSDLKVDEVQLTADGADVKIAAADGQTIAFSDGSGDSGAEFTLADGSKGAVSLILDSDVGGLKITDGTITTMRITADKDVTVASLEGSGSGTSFVIDGSGDLTVSGAFSGGSVTSAEGHLGRLILQDLRAGGTVVIAGPGAGEAAISENVAENIAFVGGEGEDALTLGISGAWLNIWAAGAGPTVTFDAGGGDDTLTFDHHQTQIGNGADSGGALKADMGDGDDVVTINAGLTISDGGVLDIDFGAGDADTLEIGENGNVKLPGSGVASIKGLNALDVSAGSLDVGQDVFDSWDFQLRGGGLAVTLNGRDDLDLSGLTNDGRSMPGLTVMAGTANDVVVTLGRSVAETVNIRLCNALQYVTLTGFTARQDKIDASGGATKATTATATDLTGDVKPSETVAENLKNAGYCVMLASQTSGTWAWGHFEQDGATYVVASDDATPTVVRLMGVDWQEADLQASLLTD